MFFVNQDAKGTFRLVFNRTERTASETVSDNTVGFLILREAGRTSTSSPNTYNFGISS